MIPDQVIINHPVHLVTKSGKRSPSAFIPYCDFGGVESSVGVKIQDLDFYVCNSFEAKIYNDQLCYEVDLNRFSNKDNIKRELGLGFNFLLNYNEDRQIKLESQEETTTDNVKGLANLLPSSDEDASIYLDTIGINSSLDSIGRGSSHNIEVGPYAHDS